MTRALDITESQRQSSDRWDLEGVVYLLSGTLVGRDSVPNASLYWGTRSLTALGQQFKAYIGPPQNITRVMGFEPGAPGSFPEIRIPIRNLPFAHSESLVAAVTDDDFRWENTTATLRVAYLRPGQSTGDLVDADWTPLVLNGFLGPPDEITLDGFVLPLYNRGARRNQNIVWPQLPSLETMSGGSIDAKDAGAMPPMIIGSPRDWVRVPTLNLGVRGFTSSGYNAGTTQLTFRTITVGPERLGSGFVGSPYESGGAQLQIHTVYPLYRVVSAAYSEPLKEFTVTLASGLASSVPRGAFVQQYGPGYRYDSTINEPVAYGSRDPGYGEKDWGWALGSYIVPFNDDPVHSVPNVGDPKFGWLFSDGQVRPADHKVWPIHIDMAGVSLSGEGGRNTGDLSGSGYTNSDFRVINPGICTLITLARSTPVIENVSTTGNARIHAPVYYDPAVSTDVSITAQPEFRNDINAFSVINLPTGASAVGGNDVSGNDPDNVIDGADITYYQVDDSHTLTVTFPSVSAPYVNTDTDRSVLHLKIWYIAAGGIEITVAGITYDITTPFNNGSTTPVEFVHVYGAPVNFNASVTIRSDTFTSGIGRVSEVWWEHDISTTVASTRTTDVAISTASGVAVGPIMEYADLVIMPSSYLSSSTVGVSSGGVYHGQTSGTLVEYDSPDNFYGAGYDPGPPIPYPSTVMLSLHGLLGLEGDITTVNLDSYRAAQSRFATENIRLSFVWDDKSRPRDWTELEQRVGMQSRSFMFYGVSGHEILFLENDYDAFPVLQTFRLPGCPGADTVGAGQPLFARTLTTELTNVYDLQWNPDPLTRELRGVVSARNEESIADIGVRASDRGAAKFDLHTPWDGNDDYTVAETVSGIAQFYADRQAFAQTRFTFNTAWIAHGLDRGSVIRITYAVSNNPPSFRSVQAEVESVSVSPIDGDKFTLVARSVGKPQKVTLANLNAGSEGNFTWAEVFTSTDEWSDQAQQDFDTWSDLWSTR